MYHHAGSTGKGRERRRNINTVPTQRQVKLVAISQDALDQATTLITKISGMFFRQLPLSPDILASGPNLHKNKHQTLKRMQHKYSAWLVFLDSVGTLHLIGSRGQVNALLKELATFAAPKVKPEVPEEVEREEREVTRTMKLGEFAGFIVGANGSRVKSLGVRFGVELCVDRQGVLSITGLEESVSKAEKKVARLIAGQEQRSGTKQRSVLAPAPVATSASNQQVVTLSGQQSKQQVAW